MSRDKTEQTRVYVRKFLNKPKHETHAFILMDSTAHGPQAWTNPKSKGEKSGVNSPRFYAYMTLGDCSRTITLDFNINNHHDQQFKGKMSSVTRDEYENSRQKAVQLRDACDQLIAQMDAWKERNFTS